MLSILGYNHAYCEEDGSLSDDGFEIITQPHSIEEFFKLNWHDAFEYLIENGYRAHDAGNCGLHLHFSREWFGDTEAERVQNIAKMVIFYDRNFDTLYKLSRRSNTEYCSRDYSSHDFAQSLTDADAENLMDGKKYGSRYTAVNLTCYDRHKTVEFRLGRGTLNYDTFRAWVDLHKAIAEQSRTAQSYDFAEWINADTVETETLEYIAHKLGDESRDCDTHRQDPDTADNYSTDMIMSFLEELYTELDESEVSA